MELLKNIQQSLTAPKNQFNKFGNFKYRSAEDILEAVKPLLGDGVLTLSDEVVMVGDTILHQGCCHACRRNNINVLQCFCTRAPCPKGDERKVKLPARRQVTLANMRLTDYSV